MRARSVAVLTIALVVTACRVVTAPTTVPLPSASATTALSGTPTPMSSAATIGQAADDGARIIDVRTLGPRTRDLTIESPAVGTVKARLLLPTGYADQPSARYPVLYLLHGGGGEYLDWSQETKVEAYTAPLDMMVVMPAAASSGMDGWYTDWQGAGAHGRPLWETFHLTELRQLLERNWQASDQRAVAGLSLGGYGAVLYSERHPGLFRAAASYSGVLDITAYQDHLSDPNATARWGDVAIDPTKLALVNPINLVSALQGMSLYISHGNGEPGPLDPPTKEYDSLEAWVGEGDDHFTAALRLAGIPATVNDYGPGTHSWAYWDRELRDSLPMLAEALGKAPPIESPVQP